MPPTLTVTLPTFGDALGGDWRRLLGLAVAAEEAGVDRVVVPEHVVLGKNTDAYPWGRFPAPPEAPWLDPIVVLSAIAGVTERLRLGTGILVAPLRPAVVLAKAVATLDVLTGGRVDLGVGTGWQREELEAAGVSYEDRGRILTDTVAACRALWTDLPASFSSPTISFDEIYCAPHPVQQPLPVWFAGTVHGRNLRRIAELGDGWIPIMGSAVSDIAAGVDRIRDALTAAGRDPSLLQVRASLPPVRDDAGAVDLERTIEAVPSLVGAGATDIGLNLRTVDPDLHDPPATFRRIVDAYKAAAGD
jgi:probable F420-dependent oxidoreductase